MSIEAKKTIILTGASGNVGSRVAKLVIPSYKGNVILTGRDKTRLSDPMKEGVKICVGSIDDTQFLSRLFRNAESALIIVPFPRYLEEFNLFQRRVVESLFEAIKGSSLKYVIHVSCLGSHRPDKTGPIFGNYDLERRLNWIKDIHILHLRPSFLMEGFLDFLSFDKEKGIITSPLYPHTPLPLISVEDVAQAAAGYLLNPSFRGQSIHQLPGPKALSMERIVHIIGETTNRGDLKYELIDYKMATNNLIGKGYSMEWVKSWISCFRYMNEDRDLFGDLKEETLNARTFEELAPFLVSRFKEISRS